MTGRGESLHSPRRVDAQVRAAKAVEMRAHGHSYCEIAQTLGYKSPNVAYNAVVRTLNKVAAESVETLRQMEDKRLDEKHRVLAPLMKPGAETGLPSMHAIALDLKVQERRARLHGLDAPVQAAVDLNAEWLRLYKLAQDDGGEDEAAEPDGEA